MTAAGELLDRLLAATPMPPDELADAPTLRASIDASLHARRELLAAAVAAPLVIDSAADADKLAELHARDRQWLAALSRAQAELGRQLIGARRARAYTASGL